MRSDSTSWLLVDTNILVYPYDPRDPAKQARAKEVLDRIEGDRRGAVSIQILGEFFNTVTRKIPAPLDAPLAQRRVVNISRSFRVIDLTLGPVLEAIRACVDHQMSYWDALIWSTAKENDISQVLTEDIQSSATIEGVRFLNPFDPSFDLSQL